MEVLSRTHTRTLPLALTLSLARSLGLGPEMVAMPSQGLICVQLPLLGVLRHFQIADDDALAPHGPPNGHAPGEDPGLQGITGELTALDGVTVTPVMYISMFTTRACQNRSGQIKGFG